MGYAAKYLQAYGQPCTILRTLAVQSYVSLKRASRGATSPGTREAYWEGLILAASSLASGEVFQIGSDKYLTLSAWADPATGELSVLVAKTNASLTHQRYVESVDGWGNIIQTWTTLNVDVPAFIEIVTYQLRQFDPGLLEQTRYIAQVPKSIGVAILDRFVLDEDNYQVVSINNAGLRGISILQLGIDTRS